MLLLLWLLAVMLGIDAGVNIVVVSGVTVLVVSIDAVVDAFVIIVVVVLGFCCCQDFAVVLLMDFYCC